MLRDKRELLEDDIKSKLPGILENYGINIIKSYIRLSMTEPISGVCAAFAIIDQRAV